MPRAPAVFRCLFMLQAPLGWLVIAKSDPYNPDDTPIKPPSRMNTYGIIDSVLNGIFLAWLLSLTYWVYKIEKNSQGFLKAMKYMNDNTGKTLTLAEEVLTVIRNTIKSPKSKGPD